MKVTYTGNGTKLIIESNEVSDVLQVLSLFTGKSETRIELPKQEVRPIVLDTKYPKPLPKTNEDKDNQLIFYKCKTCGSTSYHIGKAGDEVTCYYYKEHRPLDPVHEGSYECSCGSSCSFLMEDCVSELNCKNKDCDSKFLMIWDNATDSYVGSEVK